MNSIDAMPQLTKETMPLVLDHSVRRLPDLPPDSLVSREVAAKALGIVPGTLSNWVSQEKRMKNGVPLRVVKLGHLARYRVGDILNLIRGES